MNHINFIKKAIFTVFAMWAITSCVQDDEFAIPPSTCTQELTSNISIQELKAMYLGGVQQITEDLVLEGYVSSSDQTGNIYKTIYIQNALENPTQGFSLSVDVTDTYINYPVGGKIFVKLQGLYLGQYGGVTQLGDVTRDEVGTYEFGRIPEAKVLNSVYLSCDAPGTVVPLPVSLASMNNDLVGALIQLDNMEVIDASLCQPYATQGSTVNVTLQNCNSQTIVLRNSGYASFTNDIMPGGNGKINAILSKFNSTWQLYIRDTTDVMFDGTRCDGSEFSCEPPEDNANISDLKSAYTGSLTQIDQDLNVTATIVANDASGNLYKLLYVEDETGGIRVRINVTDLYLNPNFQVGKKVTIKANGLYIDNVNGEYHLGGLYNGAVGNIEASEVFGYIYNNSDDTVEVVPETITISGVSEALLGTLVKFDNVEFVDADAGVVYAGTTTTNRTFKDCNGNTMIIRTSNFADFATQLTPTANGSLTGVLSIYNGTYQLWLRTISDVQMNNPERCDGSTATTALFQEDFTDGLTGWQLASTVGNTPWQGSSYGGVFYARNTAYGGSGNAIINMVSWLISPSINFSNTENEALTLKIADAYSNGNPIEVYYSTDYVTGENPGDATWTRIGESQIAALNQNTTFYDNNYEETAPISLSNVNGNAVIAIVYNSAGGTISTTVDVSQVKVSGE